MNPCPKCGYHNAEDAVQCINCGYDLLQEGGPQTAADPLTKVNTEEIRTERKHGKDIVIGVIVLIIFTFLILSLSLDLINITTGK